MNSPTATDRDLAELVERLERVEWRDVPGVSASTAAAFAAQVDAARETIDVEEALDESDRRVEV